MEPPAFPRLSPMSEEEVERALEVGLAPAPITDARRKAETPVRPCWEGAGPEQVQSQPLDPLCQHLSGGAPRSLPVLAPSHSHTQEVLWAYIPPPTATNSDTQKLDRVKNYTEFSYCHPPERNKH